MIHVINFSPVPTTETWIETLKTQKGHYDPKKIHKRTEIKTNDPHYNKKFCDSYRKKASKSVSPKRSH